MDRAPNICTLLLQKTCHKLPEELGPNQLAFGDAFLSESLMKEAQSVSPVMREHGKVYVRAKP